MFINFFFIFLSSFCFTSIFFLNRWGAKSAKTSATTRVRSKQIFIIYFASSRFLLLLLFPLPFFFFNMKVVYWKTVDCWLFLNRWGAKSAKTSATTRVRSKQIFIIYFASSRFLLLLLFPLPFFFFNMKVVYWKTVDWYYKYYNNCLLLSVTPAKSRITFKMLRHKRRVTWNRMGQNKIYHAHVS